MKTNTNTKTKLLKHLGKRIKSYRILANKSQETLAFEVGIDRTYIGALEQGTRSPSIYCLYQIADKLNVKLSDLLNFEELKI